MNASAMEIVPYDLGRICRCCKGDQMEMVSVFEECHFHDRTARIDEMLMACAAVQVKPTDGLPVLICLRCSEQLKGAFIFKQQCQVTDSSLREYVRNITVEEIKQELQKLPAVPDSSTIMGVDDGGLSSVPVNNAPMAMTAPTTTTTTRVMPEVKELEEDEEEEDDPPKPQAPPRSDFIEFLDHNQMILTCRECAKVFTTLDGLRSHKRIHMGTLFKCKYCGKGYTRQTHVVRHEMSHEKHKLHVCRICNKTLTRMEHLKRHLTTHLKEKPFSCKSCNRGFNRTDHLEAHALRCKGDRKYICDICNRGFIREDSLQVHKRLHENQKPELPTLDNIDNIEEHYYEIDHDPNADFSPPSDIDEDYMEPHVEVTEQCDDQYGDGYKDTKVKQMDDYPNNVLQQPKVDLDADNVDGADESADVKNISMGNSSFMKDGKLEDDGGDDNDEVDLDDSHPMADDNGFDDDDDDNDGDNEDGDGHHHHVDDGEVLGGEGQQREKRADVGDASYDDLYEEHVNNDVENFAVDENDDSESVHSEYLPTTTVKKKKKATPSPAKGAKRGRGRPRKNPLSTTPSPAKASVGGATGKRGRGRPPRSAAKKALQTVLAEMEEEGREEDEGGEEMEEEEIVEGQLQEGGANFPCTVCDEVFPRMRLLDKHVKNAHKNASSHTCKVCTKQFSRFTHLKRHMASHALVKPHKCDQCSKTFARRDHMNQHRRMHDKRTKEWNCEACPKRFHREDQLIKHQAAKHGIHGDAERHTCDQCPKTFARRDHLNQHKRVHNRKLEYFCDVCAKGFYREDQLIKHQASKHGTGENMGGDGPEGGGGDRRFECHVCLKTFTTEKYRDVHMRGHTGEKRHKCKVCDKCFLSKSHLTEHIKFHNEHSKKFLCSECGQRFIRNDYLIIHMRRHRGEKPFKCKFCGKGFPRTTDLTVHERYHTGEKTHLCTICGRGFGRAYNLTVHMRTHTGEKPYQCTYCEAAFAQGNDLKAHVRRHTGERFHCDLCPETFLMGYLLTQHKRSIHGLNVVSNIRRLTPVSKIKQDCDEPPPITIPLPKPAVPEMLLNNIQAQLAVQMHHHQIMGNPMVSE